MLSVIIIGFGYCNSTALAQGGDGGGGGGGGGDTGGGSQVVDPGVPPSTGQGGNAGNAGSNVAGAGEGVGELGNTVQLDPFNDDTFDDNRNQGFVGVSAQAIDQRGFIGRPGELTGPPLAEGALGQGGINNQSNSTVNIGSTGGGRGAGFGAVTNGVTITRRNMRSNVTPSFYAPQRTDQQVSSRFNNRFVLQPGSQPESGSYSLTIQQRTAFLTGSVNTSAESDRLVRQLRLEPGVDKIVNQLKVLN